MCVLTFLVRRRDSAYGPVGEARWLNESQGLYRGVRPARSLQCENGCVVQLTELQCTDLSDGTELVNNILAIFASSSSPIQGPRRFERVDGFGCCSCEMSIQHHCT